MSWDAYFWSNYNISWKIDLSDLMSFDWYRYFILCPELFLTSNQGSGASVPFQQWSYLNVIFFFFCYLMSFRWIVNISKCFWRVHPWFKGLHQNCEASSSKRQALGPYISPRLSVTFESNLKQKLSQWFSFHTFWNP